MKKQAGKLIALVATVVLASAGYVQADSPGSVQKEDVKAAVVAPDYSPYAGQSFPTRVYWGDTHVHTDNSLDAKGLGVTIGPEGAFRFARGEEVTTSHGLQFKLYTHWTGSWWRTTRTAWVR